MEIVAYEMKYVNAVVREKSNDPIVLHVAKWNDKVLSLYQTAGFEITKVEKVR